MKNLSNRLFGGSSNGGLKGRSRSQSILHVGSGDKYTPNDSAGPSTASSSSHLDSFGTNKSRPQIRSTRSAKLQSDGTAAQLGVRSSSPSVSTRALNDTGVPRSISPLASHKHDLKGTFKSPSSTTLPLQSDHQDKLGRSMSDRSTASSLPMGRIGPIRRQSTHLVPPVVGNLGVQDQPQRQVLSTSNSFERLPPALQKLEDEHRSGYNRERAASSASSAATSSGARGITNKIAKLLNRGQSPRSGSVSSVISSNVGHGRDVEELSFTAAPEQLMGMMPDNSRQQRPADMHIPTSAASSRRNSPAPSLHPLPEVPPMSSLLEGYEIGTVGTRESVDLNGIGPLDTGSDQDWEGNLSDDDEEEDCGGPVRQMYGGNHMFRGGPERIEDLRHGTWSMNSHGWRGDTTPSTHTPMSPGGLGLSWSANGGHNDHGGTISHNASENAFDLPATIAEAEGETESNPPGDSPPIVSTRPPSHHQHHYQAPTSPVRTAHPPSTQHQSSPARRANSFRSGNRTAALQHSTDRMGCSPSTHFDHFADAEEDEEDEGLEIDVASKRGRRASKPHNAYTGPDHKVPLPPHS